MRSCIPLRINNMSAPKLERCFTVLIAIEFYVRFAASLRVDENE